MAFRAALPTLLPIVVFLVATASVQAVGAEPPRAEIFDSAYLLQVIGSLLLVFGCLFGLAFFMKKMNGVPAGDRKSLRIVGSLKVGNREKIVLLDTGENQVLVGVAAGNVRTLYVYESPGEAGRDEGADQEESATTKDFASLMPAKDMAGAQV